MNAQTIEAVYEHGAFRPVGPLHPEPSEGQRVRLVVEAVGDPQAYLKLAAQVFEGLSEEDVDAVEAAAKRRPDFFGPRCTPADER
jgi:predicted DNA-binding antitoxin AbrB/MazE fold protein